MPWQLRANEPEGVSEEDEEDVKVVVVAGDSTSVLLCVIRRIV